MNFSISSANMTILISNIFIFLLFLIFRNQKVRFNLGLPILIGFIFLICLRMMFPIEILSLSHNIYLPETLTIFIGELRRVRFFNDNISWWNVLEIFWGCGILYSLMNYLKNNFYFYQFVKKYANPLDASSKQMQAFSLITKKYSKKNIHKIRELQLPLIKSPIIYGLRKPFILLPEGLELSDSEWYYVFLHEANHYIHKDLYIKLFLYIICMIYWWNPLCYFLKKESDLILEMRIDQTLVNTQNQKSEYLSCLLKVVSYQVTDSLPTPAFSISFCNSVLAQRFNALTKDTKQSDSCFFKLVTLIAVIFLYFGSYFIIFEDNYFPADQFTEEIIIPSKDNCFIIECPDGQYDFYLLGKYIETLPDKNYCVSDINIYKNIKEARKHEKIFLEK